MIGYIFNREYENFIKIDFKLKQKVTKMFKYMRILKVSKKNFEKFLCWKVQCKYDYSKKQDHSSASVPQYFLGNF